MVVVQGTSLPPGWVRGVILGPGWRGRRWLGWVAVPEPAAAGRFLRNLPYGGLRRGAGDTRTAPTITRELHSAWKMSSGGAGLGVAVPNVAETGMGGRSLQPAPHRPAVCEQVVQVMLEDVADDAQVHLLVAVYQYVSEAGHGVEYFGQVLRNQAGATQGVE